LGEETMDWLEATVPFVRGIHMAAVLSIFGALVFRLLIAPRSLARAGPDAFLLVRQGLARCFWASIAVAIVSGFGWLIFETAMFTGPTTVAAVTLSLAPVAFDTRFGNLLMLRIGTLVLCALLFGRGTHRGRLAIATVLAGGSVAVQAGIGHAGAIGGTEGIWLMTSEVLHLLAAGAWLGGLAPLSSPSSRCHPARLVLRRRTSQPWE
jgi:putative copper resistance protein D